MPYKDPEHKKQWEESHRVQRLVRRRELRRVIDAHAVQANAIGADVASTLPWVVVVAASGLAYHNPQVGLAVGCLTLGMAALRGKGWQWRMVGAFVILLSVFLLWQESSEKEEERPDS